MSKLNRRNFLKTSLLGVSALAMPSWINDLHAQAPTDNPVGANDDIRVAVIGLRSRGNDHINDLLRCKGVRIVALCDVDTKVLDQRVAQLDQKGIKVKKYVNMRDVFDDPEVDAVSMATPNHWHSLGTIWACQAGKDVYVEKPVSHNVNEGRRMVEAARKYERIVQTGTQCRSSVGLQEAIAWLREGNLGKIKVARGLCYKRRDTIGNVHLAQPIPSHIDYNLWCGPAPMPPLTRRQLHYDWHWVWATGCGDLGNQGIHQMDIARWALGVNTLSRRVWSVGGRYGYIDDGETPNTQLIYHDYGKKSLIFEVRGLPTSSTDGKMDNLKGASIGVIIECEGGYMVNPSYTSATAYDNDGNEIRKFNGGGNHHANWLDAVRSRKVSDLNSDIIEGHVSSALCHTGNISYRMGQLASPKQVADVLNSLPNMAEAGQRMWEHLQANNIDLNREKTYLGPVLEMYEGMELFVGNDKANAMMTRDYRYPFVVPDYI